MPIRPVLTHPDPRLKVTARPVEVVDDAVRSLITDLLDTMYDQGGIGLAATQIGDDRRVVVMDCRDSDGERAPMALVNPTIAEQTGEVVWREGCLSVPGVTADVDRAARVVVNYLDAAGDSRRLEAGGLLAVCIQHELDHLDGTLYVDRLGLLERRAVLLEYANLEADGPREEHDEEKEV